MFGVTMGDFETTLEDLRREMDAYSCHVHGRSSVGVCVLHMEAICRKCGRCDGCLTAGLGREA